MPKGTTRMLGRMASILLVLTGILLAGNLLAGNLLAGTWDVSAAIPVHAGHHHSMFARQASIAHPDTTQPCSAVDGLPCCLACACVMHVVVFPDGAAVLPHRPVLIAGYPAGPFADWISIATIPAQPPPRPLA